MASSVAFANVAVVDDEPEVAQTPQSPSASDVADHDH